jgi:hypothetical protein
MVSLRAFQLAGSNRTDLAQPAANHPSHVEANHCRIWWLADLHNMI